MRRRAAAQAAGVFADEIVPVCAPDLAGGPDALDGMTLLHDQTWADDWSIWSRTTGVQIKEPRKGPQFSLYSLAVEEAKAGAGVLMGHVCLIEDALASNALKPASQHSCHTGRFLFCALPDAARQRAETEQIVSLLSQAS